MTKVVKTVYPSPRYSTSFYSPQRPSEYSPYWNLTHTTNSKTQMDREKGSVTELTYPDIFFTLHDFEDCFRSGTVANTFTILLPSCLDNWNWSCRWRFARIRKDFCKYLIYRCISCMSSWNESLCRSCCLSRREKVRHFPRERDIREVDGGLSLFKRCDWLFIWKVCTSLHEAKYFSWIGFPLRSRCFSASKKWVGPTIYQTTCEKKTYNSCKWRYDPVCMAHWRSIFHTNGLLLHRDQTAKEELKWRFGRLPN